jgi:anaerobic magnesium-protoporphyrin IX monomethyl ester cyclase
MWTLLINPPYQTITSNRGVGHQVPLGLLMVGGALRDAGFDVRLLDAEALRWTDSQVAEHVRRSRPAVVMTGHAGSTPAHPVCMTMLAAIKRAYPAAVSVYGGVFPTYNDEQVLHESPFVDVVVRGEGEATAVALARALGRGVPADLTRLADVEGITLRRDDLVVRNPDRAAIDDLDAFRVGWELLDDWDRYRCFGRGRAAIVQLSRGCPHRCTYCGQHGFWKRWRYRDPDALADEVQWLHDEHGIRFITLADENPTTRQDVWVRFLEATARRAADVQFLATIRATDIVRDADVIDLYRRAGIRYVLMGIDTTDPGVIEQVRKRSTTRHDLEACRLLRENGIHSIIGHIVGLGSESWGGLRRAGRALRMYDGDYLNAMYATPHAWTAFAHDQADRRVVQEDQRRWDYRHQILDEPRLRPWQLFAAVKWLELAFHLRPRRLRRLLLTRDRSRRNQGWWNARHTTMVWVMEIIEFVRHFRSPRHPRPLREWWPQTGNPMSAAGPPRGPKPVVVPPPAGSGRRPQRQDRRTRPTRTLDLAGIEAMPSGSASGTVALSHRALSTPQIFRQRLKTGGKTAIGRWVGQAIGELCRDPMDKLERPSSILKEVLRRVILRIT